MSEPIEFSHPHQGSWDDDPSACPFGAYEGSLEVDPVPFAAGQSAGSLVDLLGGEVKWFLHFFLSEMPLDEKYLDGFIYTVSISAKPKGSS